MSEMSKMSKMLRGARSALVAAGIAAVLAGAVSAPAGALSPPGRQAAGLAGPKPPVPGRLPGGSAPGGFATWSDFYAMQGRLDAAATAILAAGGAGKASIVISAASRALTVYWPGRVPAQVQALAPGLGVRVRFAPAAFPMAELVSQARRLAGDPRVAAAAPEADGSGLSVTLARTLSSPAEAVAQRELRAQAAVPLTITAGPRLQPLFSRQADIPPFWGGSRYATPSAHGCSNGFALSAGHCGEVGQDVTVPGQPGPAGAVIAKLQCRDALVIQYPDGVDGRIYTGAFDSQDSLPVSGAVPDFVGDLVETGGASSGEHFNIPIWATDVFAAETGNPCTVVGPLTEVMSFDPPQCVAAPGDSGGPVYSFAADGTVIARGTMSAGGLTSIDCPGIISQGYNAVFYAPLLRPDGDPEVGTLQFLPGGATILTG
jgi:hypothetical protein